MEKIPMTKEGFRKLQDELDRLRRVERPQALQAMNEAAGHGDISDNADYRVAKERRDYVESRIKELDEGISIVVSGIIDRVREIAAERERGVRRAAEVRHPLGDRAVELAVADAIEREDWPALREELGDLLFQVVFYAQMGREKGWFDFAGIASDIADKMEVGALIIGLPLNLDGSEGPRAQSTRAFARNLAKLTELPIALWDERLSTAAVERELIAADVSRSKRASVIDQHAAAFILQGALDRLASLAVQQGRQ